MNVDCIAMKLILRKKMMMNNAIRRVETIMYKRIKSKPPYYRRSMQDSNLHADDDKLNLNGG